MLPSERATESHARCSLLLSRNAAKDRSTHTDEKSQLGGIGCQVSGTALYPVPSCFYFESQFMADSLAIRVAMVLILVPFSVQSKICKIDSIKY